MKERSDSDVRQILLPRALSQKNREQYRNHREMITMCSMLDHIALGRYAEAAGLVAARLKAIEVARREERRISKKEPPLLYGL